MNISKIRGTEGSLLTSLFNFKDYNILQYCMFDKNAVARVSLQKSKAVANQFVLASEFGQSLQMVWFVQKY